MYRSLVTFISKGDFKNKGYAFSNIHLYCTVCGQKQEGVMLEIKVALYRYNVSCVP